MTGLGAFYELSLMCCGTPDARTGYLINISELDSVARRDLVPIIQNTYSSAPATEPASLLPALFEQFRRSLPDTASALRWHLTPFYNLTIEADSMNQIQLSQQFEFAAAHRLNVSDYSEKANQSIFGKCNNPNGHGHNYRIEVAITLPTTAENSSSPFSHSALESIVKTIVIDRFDHKNLNADCSEFEMRNPSVENIASTCFAILEEPLQLAGADLHHVTVWETAKTSCTVARND